MEGMVNKMSKSTTKQKKSSAGKNVAIFFIVFVILEGLIIFGLSQAFKNEDSVVKIAGYSFFLMDSDNMGADAPKDSLVIASNGTPAKDKKGFAMLCKNVENEGTTVAWLYDISSKGDTVDGVVYTVFQEAYPDKMYDLKSEDIVGIATSYYKTAGKIVSFVTTPFGMGVCIAVPIFLLIVIELIISASRRSREDDYDDDDDEDYDDDYDRNDNVTLDDFLYGGENDDVYTTGKPKETYQEEFEDKYASLLDRKPAPEPVPAPHSEPQEELLDNDDDNFGVYPFNVQSEPEPESEPESAAEEAPKNEVDPSYYEKAAKLIDEAVANVAEPAEEEKPAAAPAPQRKPRPQGQGAPRAKRPPQQGGRRPAGAANTQRRPRPQQSGHTPPRQDANAALQQLMQMMEEEQSKLKKSDKE